MIMINNQWYNIQSMDDIQRIISEEFSEEVAEEISRFMPEHTDYEYYEIFSQLEETDLMCDSLYDQNEY